MKTVKMHTVYAGPLGTCHAGHEIDLPDADAAALVKGKYAEYATASAAPAPPTVAENATAEPEETADNAPAYRSRQRGGKA